MIPKHSPTQRATSVTGSQSAEKYTLSWQEQLAATRVLKTAGQVMIKLFGVSLSFAIWMGLAEGGKLWRKRDLTIEEQNALFFAPAL